MFILRDLFNPLQTAFSDTEKAQERALWFTYTLLAILIPITSARTSNLLRCLQSLFNLSISKRRFYTFMASPKLPWENVWKIIWQMIPQPFTEGRLITALDDSINCKTGKKIFGCQYFFDHAAKANQSRYPWSQNIVTLGLLKQVHGRWCCLPMGFAFYFMKKTLMQMSVKMGSKSVEFKTKFEQAVDLLTRVSRVFVDSPILVVTDSWFGNAGLLKPLRLAIGARVQILSRLRVNAVLYAALTPCLGKRGPGRPRKYGERLGSAADLAAAFQSQAKSYTLPLYGKVREVMAYDQVVLLKTLRCQVRVVWVFRKTQWIALVTTDLDLSVQQIIEYYAARWKIEAGFKEIKQEIGSAHSQSRNPFAVTNHLQFCMLATTLVWVYAERLENTPKRRYATQNRTEYAFADVRRIIADEIGRPGFVIRCHKSLKSTENTLLQSFMRLVA
jgi:hypothetical protein